MLDCTMGQRASWLCSWLCRLVLTFNVVRQVLRLFTRLIWLRVAVKHLRWILTIGTNNLGLMFPRLISVTRPLKIGSNRLPAARQLARMLRMLILIVSSVSVIV